MLKKILIAVLILGILGVAAVALLGYGTYKVMDDAVKEREPQFRQYLQMDEAAQNQYVLENIDELLDKVENYADDNPEGKATRERLKELNAQPEIQAALIDVGRSFTASVMLLSNSIVEEMTPEVKAKKESDEFEARMEKYTNLIKAADPTLKFGE